VQKNITKFIFLGKMNKRNKLAQKRREFQHIRFLVLKRVRSEA